MFGFNLPRIPFFSGDTTANEAQDKIDTTITSVKALNNGYYQLVIADNNAVWVTTDDSINFDPPRAGQKIEIVRGALGNYFLRINGQVGVRGKRVGLAPGRGGLGLEARLGIDIGFLPRDAPIAELMQRDAARR